MVRFDVILNFFNVHSSCIHKYLYLNKQLNKKLNCLLILQNGKFGVSPSVFRKFNSKDLINTINCSEAEAHQICLEQNPRVQIIDGDKNRTLVTLPEKTAEVSCVFYDFYRNNSKYVAAPTPLWYDNTIKSKCPADQDNILYVNNFIWDFVEECLPHELKKEDFCLKYNLDPNKKIFTWCPDSIQCQNSFAQQAYKDACEIDNLIIKLHPNEIRRHKAEKFNGRWSYEIFTDKKLPILDPLDGHWCYKYSDCLIGYQTTTAIEIPIAYKTPFLYINTKDGSWDKNDSLYQNTFSWVGQECNKNLKKFLEEEKYIVSNDDLWEAHKAKFLYDSLKSGAELLTETVLKLV
jgi:hypothetical protein